ncbi:hypothetical protein WMZ97_05120 [Lentibacillus sp. N15]
MSGGAHPWFVFSKGRVLTRIHRRKGGSMLRTILMIIGAIVVIGWIISIL